jgi:hypothetical protein
MLTKCGRFFLIYIENVVVVQVVFMSLLAMLPSPIIYGAIIDNTCILWQEVCHSKYIT